MQKSMFSSVAVALLATLPAALLLTPTPASGFGPMNMMNPNQWFSGSQNREERESHPPSVGYYPRQGYYPPHGYGAPLQGYHHPPSAFSAAPLAALPPSGQERTSGQERASEQECASEQRIRELEQRIRQLEAERAQSYAQPMGMSGYVPQQPMGMSGYAPQQPMGMGGYSSQPPLGMGRGGPYGYQSGGAPMSEHHWRPMGAE